MNSAPIKNTSKNPLSESSKVWTQTNRTEFESGRSLLRFKIDVNENLANKYADLMSKNEKLDLVMDESEEEESKMLKRKRELQL